MTTERTTWPAGHVVSMTMEGTRERPVSVATCQCGFVSRKNYTPGGLALQDFALERHWRIAEGRRRINAPPAPRVYRTRPKHD